MKVISPEKCLKLEITASKVLAKYMVCPTMNQLYNAALETIPEDLMHIVARHGGVPSSNHLLLDLLGIDVLAEYEGVRYAIDLTLSSKKNLRRKFHKMSNRKPFYDKLNVVPIVIRMDESSVATLPTEEFFVWCFKNHTQRIGVRFADGNDYLKTLANEVSHG